MKMEELKMEFGLLLLFLTSIIYCRDIPVIKGCEVFVNNHDSMLYGVGLSVIAAYIFYIFQVIIPRFLYFRRTRNIGCTKSYEVEESMTKVLSFLQGEPPNSGIPFSKELIRKNLEKINIFYEKSRYEIHNHRELSVSEAITYYDDKTMSLIDEIFSGQYLEYKYEKVLLNLKTSGLHTAFEQWKTNLPGEYEHFNLDLNKETSAGYNFVNKEAVNSDIICSIDEYLNIYGQDSFIASNNTMFSLEI